MNTKLILIAITIAGSVACAAPVTPIAPSDGATATTIITATAIATTAVEASATPVANTPTLEATVTATPDSTGEVPTDGELLLIHEDALVGVSLVRGTMRKISTDVSDFVVSPDNNLIATIRGRDQSSQLWLVSVDGSEQLQLSDDKRVYASMSWLPDGSGLVYAASTATSQNRSTWLDWAAFCRESSIYLMRLDTRKPQQLGEGCDPAVSPDGRRIAYATRPTRSDAQTFETANTAGNSIHLINIKGENGWNPVKAAGGEVGEKNPGLVAYQPVWSTDSRRVLYHVFIGMRVEVDINLLSIVDAKDGTQTLLGDFAGWSRQLSLSPNGTRYGLTSQNTGDARGFGGWDVWRTEFFDFTGTREIILPDGAFQAQGQTIAQPLWYGQRFAWLSDEKIAMVMPPTWVPGSAPNAAEELGMTDQPGAVWVLSLNETPTAPLFEGVQFGSPIAYIP
jgi:hypothetical protein